MADVLKEYLYRLGFQIDDGQYQRFRDRLDYTTKQVENYGRQATETGIAVALMVERISKQYENLYFASVRIGSSAANLEKFAFGSRNIGISADQARDSLARLNLSMLSNPGARALANMLTGVNTSALDTKKTMDLLIDRFASMPPYVAAAFGNMYGISLDEMRQRILMRGEEKRAEEAYSQRLAESGVNMDELARRSHEFMFALRTLGTDFELVGAQALNAFLPPLTKGLEVVDNFTRLALKAGDATHGWSSAIIALGGAFGALKSAEWIIKGIFGRGAAATGAGAAGGAAAGGTAGGAATGAAAGAAPAATTTGMIRMFPWLAAALSIATTGDVVKPKGYDEELRKRGLYREPKPGTPYAPKSSPTETKPGGPPAWEGKGVGTGSVAIGNRRFGIAGITPYAMPGAAGGGAQSLPADLYKPVVPASRGEPQASTPAPVTTPQPVGNNAPPTTPAPTPMPPVGASGALVDAQTVKQMIVEHMEVQGGPFGAGGGSGAGGAGGGGGFGGFRASGQAGGSYGAGHGTGGALPGGRFDRSGASHNLPYTGSPSTVPPMGKLPGMTAPNGHGASQIYNWLRSKEGMGLDHTQASAVLGSWQQESSLNPHSQNRIGAFGLGQWTQERKAALGAFARRRGLDPASQQAQLEFFKSEMGPGGSEAKAGEMLRSARTSEEAMAGMNRYERFKGWQQGRNGVEAGHRYEYAKQFEQSMRPGAAGTSPSATGYGAPPQEILGKARQIALQGGPGAVQQFMRQQGYPMRGSWCGEFAASVVKSAGGKPPPGAAIASNWRNWGHQVETPQPGDVAVRIDNHGRYVPTGATGSHVTFVDSVDPKTGRFVGLGGNQGRFRSNYAQNRYQFFRGDPPKQPETAKNGGMPVPQYPMQPTMGAGGQDPFQGASMYDPGRGIGDSARLSPGVENSHNSLTIKMDNNVSISGHGEPERASATMMDQFSRWGDTITRAAKPLVI